MSTISEVDLPVSLGFPPGTPQRLVDSFNYYNAGARRHLKLHQRWKTLQIVASAAIPIAAVVIPGSQAVILKSVTASLGAFVAGVESFLQFQQYHQNWIRWRTAAEALRREAFLYSQKAGAYKNAEKADILLAETVEEILAVEHQSWRSLQENPNLPQKNKGRKG